MAKYCRFCGTPLTDKDHACPHCKHKVVDTCAVCGTKLYDDETFCPGCGTPIVVKCACCGREVYSGENFCPYCGSKNEAIPGISAPVNYTFPASQLQNTQFGSFGGFGQPFGGFGSFGGFGGFGQPYGGFGTFGMNQFGTSPFVLPPITLDQPAEEKPQQPEAITRTRPQPAAPEAVEKKEEETEEEPKEDKKKKKKDKHKEQDEDKAPETEVEKKEDEENEGKKSKLGLVGFIFAILSFIPIFLLISLPCCIIAIKRNNGFKKLAIAGLIIAIIWILAWAGLLIYMFAFDGVGAIEGIITDILQGLGLISAGESFTFGL